MDLVCYRTSESWWAVQGTRTRAFISQAQCCTLHEQVGHAGHKCGSPFPTPSRGTALGAAALTGHRHMGTNSPSPLPSTAQDTAALTGRGLEVTGELGRLPGLACTGLGVWAGTTCVCENGSPQQALRTQACLPSRCGQQQLATLGTGESCRRRQLADWGTRGHLLPEAARSFGYWYN
eukprot:789513-Pelagomonas_calceolata.AAC.3